MRFFASLFLFVYANDFVNNENGINKFSDLLNGFGKYTMKIGQYF